MDNIVQAWSEKTWYADCPKCKETLEVGEGDFYESSKIKCSCGHRFNVEAPVKDRVDNMFNTVQAKADADEYLRSNGIRKKI